MLFFEEFSRLLGQIAAEPSGCLLITGDFNFHMDDPDNANAKRFADLLESYDLKQHVNCGTHTSGHTLDLVITRSDDSLIKDTKVKDPVISDHLAIHCVLSIQKPQFRKKLINVRKLHSLNMDSFCKDIMDSPLLQDQATDLDMMVDQYDRVLRQLLDQHAPKKKRLYHLDVMYQSAFKVLHSTETALLKVQNDILRAVDDNKSVILLLLDLSSAFDTVDHLILLSRLSHRFGIKGNALAWFDSYLKSRKQFVQIEDCQSSQRCLAHGVPQGSVLGPLLILSIFIVYSIICMLMILNFTFLFKLTALLTSLKLSHLLSYVSKILTGG